VARGQVDTIFCGDTRSEEDFVSHIKEVVESSIPTSRLLFVADNLNINKSESLVRYVAEVSDLDIDLGLSDLEVERQMADRISFMAFLGFPDPFPDSRTIWLFRERMAKTDKDRLVWAELQRQLDAMGLQVSLTLVSESPDVVETLNAERFRMPHS
jgi:hypothetical protein